MKRSGLLGCKRSGNPTVTDYDMTVSRESSPLLPHSHPPHPPALGAPLHPAALAAAAAPPEGYPVLL